MTSPRNPQPGRPPDPRQAGHRVLVVRPDRIGDLCLTTPMFTALKLASPDAHVGALVRAETAALLTANPDVDAIVLERGQRLGSLISELEAGRWDVAVHAFLTPRTALATWRAGIPRRIGPASRWPALFLTERIVQKRSRSERHEAVYNLELLAPLGISPLRLPSRLVLTRAERAWARVHLVALGLDPDRAIVGIHPGSGNSAGRWPLTSFVALADELAGQGHQVLLTFGPGETRLAEAMRTSMRNHAVTLAGGSVDLRQMAAVIGVLALFVSNSTGPLHMAVALGVPTVSFYSLTPATTPRRWGPLAPGHEVLTPPPGAEHARRLDRIPLALALAACDRQLAAGAEPRTGE